jgi:ATP-dependent DNA helicase RecG
MDLMIAYLQQFNIGKKQDFMKLLGDKLSDTLNENQKENKIRSLLNILRRKGLIERTSANRRIGSWRLTKCAKQ